MTNPIVKRYRSWRSYRKAYRRTYDELMICSDRELNELGISRFDIDRIARQQNRG